MAIRALLFDVGGVVLSDSWSQLDALEAARGLRIPGRGPHDPDNDPAWRRHLAGEVDVEGYWDVVARGGGFDNGVELHRALLVDVPIDVLYRPEALALMADARAAGLKVGLLSNDLLRFGNESWLAAQTPLVEGIDALCDATRMGVRKPHPDAYRKAADALGLPPQDILFFDDLAENCRGAEAVGMPAVRVDEVNVVASFAEGRQRAGLRPAA